MKSQAPTNSVLRPCPRSEKSKMRTFCQFWRNAEGRLADSAVSAGAVVFRAALRHQSLETIPPRGSRVSRSRSFGVGGNTRPLSSDRNRTSQPTGGGWPRFLPTVRHASFSSSLSSSSSGVTNKGVSKPTKAFTRRMWSVLLASAECPNSRGDHRSAPHLNSYTFAAQKVPIIRRLRQNRPSQAEATRDLRRVLATRRDRALLRQENPDAACLVPPWCKRQFVAGIGIVAVSHLNTKPEACPTL